MYLVSLPFSEAKLNKICCDSQGQRGNNGLIGPPGERGLTGPAGQPGIPGAPGGASAYLTGFLLVRHSQSEQVPICPGGLTQMWIGYSLLYIEGNEKSHSQDLGKYNMLIL